MVMTRKMFKVWSAILAYPAGTWVEASDIAKKSDLTARQVLAVFSHMDCEMLIRDGSAYKFNGNEREKELTRRKIMAECYGISDDVIESVRMTLSEVGAISVTDICAETGLDKSAVSRILHMMDDVRTVPSGAQVLYYRAP